MSTKPILAFDTATAGASIALLVHGIVTTRTLEQTRQAAELVPAIDALLNESGVAYRDLGCIVTTIGPGSFTGVRIGLAALHGFVLVNHTPIKTLTTLEAMAHQVQGSIDFIIALRAGKGEIYTQKFQRAVIPAQAGLKRSERGEPKNNNEPIVGQLHSTHDSRLRGNDDVAQLQAVSDIQLYFETKTDWDVPCYGNHLPTENAHYIAGPDASTLCAIAGHLPASSLSEAMPLYIRAPDAVVGAKPAWLTAN